MKRGDLLLFGPISAVIFVLGVHGLALMVPGYSHVHQTVSEIGEVGSPANVPFTLMMCCVAVCMMVFAWAVFETSSQLGRHRIAAYLIACAGLSALGVGIFAYPNPLHNVFGLSEVIGYQAPLAFALSWRRDPKAKTLVFWSLILFVVLWIAMGLNLVPLFSPSWLWPHLRPVHGLVQRSLFLTWFAWCSIIGALMWRRQRAQSSSRQEEEIAGL
ncbi:MAG: DUF998 domain-containing protein [Rhodanobacteraceae bacterium]